MCYFLLNVFRYLWWNTHLNKHMYMFWSRKFTSRFFQHHPIQSRYGFRNSDFPRIPPRNHRKPTSPLPASPSRPVGPLQGRPANEERWSWWRAPDLAMTRWGHLFSLSKSWSLSVIHIWHLYDIYILNIYIFYMTSFLLFVYLTK